MQKERLCSRARQCGDYFPPDQAGFSDSCDNDPPLALKDQIDRAGEIPINFVHQAQDTLRFNLQNFFGALDGRSIIAHVFALNLFHFLDRFEHGLAKLAKNTGQNKNQLRFLFDRSNKINHGLARS